MPDQQHTIKFHISSSLPDRRPTSVSPIAELGTTGSDVARKGTPGPISWARFFAGALARAIQPDDFGHARAFTAAISGCRRIWLIGRRLARSADFGTPVLRSLLAHRDIQARYGGPSLSGQSEHSEVGRPSGFMSSRPHQFLNSEALGQPTEPRDAGPQGAMSGSEFSRSHVGPLPVASGYGLRPHRVRSKRPCNRDGNARATGRASIAPNRGSSAETAQIALIVAPGALPSFNGCHALEPPADRQPPPAKSRSRQRSFGFRFRGMTNMAGPAACSTLSRMTLQRHSDSTREDW